MTEFPKPKVTISKCLGFEACRFNGEVLQDKFVLAPKGQEDLLPVGPGLLVVASASPWLAYRRSHQLQATEHR